MRRLSAIVAIALLISEVGHGQAPDQLALAREALGGDSRLKVIASFTVSGSLTSHLLPVTVKNDVEIYCELPDKFVRIMRRWLNNPGGNIRVTEYSGFNGAEPIRDIQAPGSRLPMIIPRGPAPSTPEQIAASRRSLMNEGYRASTQLLVPLFATAFSGYPSRLADLDQAAQPASAAAIEVVEPGGSIRRLLLDPSSHLPVKVTWMSPAVMVQMTTATSIVSSRGDVIRQTNPVPPPPPPNPGPPTFVEWETTLSDYQLTDGLNWPHTLTTTMGGKAIEELRLDKFKINSKIDPKVFMPREPTPATK